MQFCKLTTIFLSLSFGLVKSNFSIFCGDADNLCQKILGVSERSKSPNDMLEEIFYSQRCFCDEECWKYNDCCADASLSHHAELTEEKFCHKITNQSHSVYVVKTCPSNWKDNKIRLLCEKIVEDRVYRPILDIPFYSLNTMNLYVNIFCAKCNDDYLNATVLKLNLTCEKYECNGDFRVNSTYIAGQLQWEQPNGAAVTANVDDPQFSRFRKCRQVEHDCATNWTNLLVRQLCYNSSNLYIQNKQGKIYKNIYCAKCSNEDVTKLNCPVGNSYHYGIPVRDKEQFQFNWILDFNPSPSLLCVNSDEIYDEFTDQCVSLSCRDNYDLIDGKCVLKNEFKNNTGNFSMNSCTRRQISINELLFFTNGSVYWNRTQTLYTADEIELIDNSSYSLCVDDKESPSLGIRHFGASHSVLAVICMSISIISLLVHIIIQCLTGQQRKLPGKCFLNLSLTLLIAQVLFLVGGALTQKKFVCVIVSILAHFFFLSVFFWMNIMAIDICRTFTRSYQRSFLNAQTFFYYCAYAWLIPLIIVIPAVTIDYVHPTSNIRPRYGHDACWISDRYALFIFLALPLAILLVENIIFFVITACNINKTVKMNDNLKKSTEYKRFFVYVKLAFIVGIPWIVGFAAAFTDFEPLWYGFTFLNASQGTFIFVIFTLKRSTLTQLREKLNGISSPKISSSKKTEFV